MGENTRMERVTGALQHFQRSRLHSIRMQGLGIILYGLCLHTVGPGLRTESTFLFLEGLHMFTMQ